MESVGKECIKCWWFESIGECQLKTYAGKVRSDMSSLFTSNGLNNALLTISLKIKINWSMNNNGKMFGYFILITGTV